MATPVFLAPRVADTADSNSCKQFAQPTAFGTSGLSIAAKAGRVYHVRVVNSAATRYFVQIHNKATAAVNTDVPAYEASLPASGECVIDFGLNGYYLSTGFSLAISSTKSVLTLAVATDCAAYGLYSTKT